MLEIVKRKIYLGGNICLTDVNGVNGTFKPITVIHHSGQVIGNTTIGHYQADVLDIETNQWIRTSDDELPTIITEHEITNQGYIYLLKRVFLQVMHN